MWGCKRKTFKKTRGGKKSYFSSNDKEDNDITNLQLLSRNQNKIKQLMNQLYDQDYTEAQRDKKLE